MARAPVLLDVEASSEEKLIHLLVRSLEGVSEVSDLGVFEWAVLERQRLQPPLLGNGVALPHARTAAVTGMVLAMARCRHAVLTGPDKVAVRLVFLYGIPPHQIALYLESVAHLTRRLKKPGLIEGLLASSTPDDFRALLG